MGRLNTKRFHILKTRKVNEGARPRRPSIIYKQSVKLMDEKTGELIAIFLKNVIPEKMITIGRKLISFKGKSNARGSFAGKKEKTIIQSGKHKGMTDIKGKSSNSSLVGYLLPYLVKDPKPQLSSTSKKDLELYDGELKTLYNFFDSVIKKIHPEGYKENVRDLRNVPDKIKISKITTNIQINVNQVAHYHIDNGNENRYGSIVVFYPGHSDPMQHPVAGTRKSGGLPGVPFKGGEFVLGDYDVGFDLKEGDFLYVNQWATHGTLSKTGGDRLSVVGFQSHKLINYYNKRQKGSGKFPSVVYAIPSYDRIKILTKQTLPFLERYNIPKNEIYIFVANKEQYGIYKPVLDKLGYDNVIVGVLGLKNVIRFIQNYFPNGQKIVHLDDDVRGLKECGGGKMEPIKSLKAVINKGFDILKKNKLQLFGFYPIVNELFQCKQKPITTELKFIVGVMYGYMNDKKLISTTDIILKDDYERSIRSYLKYGGVVRFNRIGIITTYDRKSGGLSELRKTGGLEKKESLILKKKYPDLVHFVSRKRVAEGFKFDIRLSATGNIPLQPKQ